MSAAFQCFNRFEEEDTHLTKNVVYMITRTIQWTGNSETRKMSGKTFVLRQEYLVSQENFPPAQH